MTIIQALILGLIQGLTEFLPISSSGHLVIGQKLLGLSQPPVLFDILVHVGTLTAIFIFFRKIIWQLTKKTVETIKAKAIPKEATVIIIGTIPAVIIGFFLYPFLEIIFSSITLVGIALVITSILLFSTIFIKKSHKKINQITKFDALVIGILQALAILPGISRSGSTVVAGLWRNLKRETAFTFSFLLSIPAILGAMTMQLTDLAIVDCQQVLPNLVGFVSAALSGYLALILFKKAVVNKKLAYFGIYCLLVGVTTLFLFESFNF